MPDYILRTHQLSKIYKQDQILRDLNLNIRKGDIYGLIGMNGAGKTTLIRILAGLIPSSGGTVELFGETDPRRIEQLRAKIGWLIETPALYLNHTAYENLEMERIHKGIQDRREIDKVLEIVGLKEAGSKKTADFSLGMKQRLGIAMALLGDPELLVLDEPINGLDPVGIAQMRELLLELNHRYGITILISSHILTELAQIATTYGIINNHTLIEELSAEELNKRSKQYLAIKSRPVEDTLKVLTTKLNTNRFEVVGSTVLLYDYYAESGRVASVLYENGISVEEISCKGQDLEHYYMGLLERK
ncbi:ATP-binding cassette domain-containing protein [Paenibacillus tuaregi]|uniref:ATP-binding cassette domain-containing protein n=1 Tax=Paenibacillus tuaregi TaxID=1816681 RepID=UPI0008395C31|nr:ATP-binding cassette domain-containing protein [Paenibacillus tuaregi]